MIDEPETATPLIERAIPEVVIPLAESATSNVTVGASVVVLEASAGVKPLTVGAVTSIVTVSVAKALPELSR